MTRFSINIVTYNSAPHIDACLASVLSQDFPDFAVTVVDNGSSDSTLTRLTIWGRRGVRIVPLRRNTYYSHAHNTAIQETDSEFVLTLNPDAVIRPNYLSRLLPAFEQSARIGAVNGKLLLPATSTIDRIESTALPSGDQLIDGAGLVLRKSRRPYLRGNRQRNDTSCLEAGYIFGVDGACGAYRRSMLEDTAFDGEYFDEEFVMYREDVDLAWRAQLYGWDSWYTPEAVGYHVRGFHLGGDRRSIPRYIRRQSVKNGWLLLIKNDTPQSLLRDTPFILPYQAKIIAGLLTVELSSLPAVGDLLKLWPRMREKRAQIQTRRTRSETEMRRWLQ